MTARARNRLCDRRRGRCVWRMAADARLARREHSARAGPGCTGMVDLPGVAARAGARGVVVRRVAWRALRVGLGREHRLGDVTRRARLDLGRLEAMRCVAARARRMPDGSRPGVTARAALIRGCALLVDAVAVDATTRAGVPGLLLRVAFRARPGIERRRLVRAMAAFTGLVGVQTHGVGGSLWLVVTPHAGGGLSARLPERVAVLARRRLCSDVERRRDRRMAALAQ